MKESKKVMLPVDESVHSERAVRWFAQNGWKAGDHLVLFHNIDNSKVVPPLGYTMTGKLATLILSRCFYLERTVRDGLPHFQPLVAQIKHGVTMACLWASKLFLTMILNSLHPDIIANFITKTSLTSRGQGVGTRQSMFET